MSVLGRACRTYLTGRTGYAATVPGGISPELAAVGTSMPYVVYQTITTQPQMLLAGMPAVFTERVQITVVSNTRASAQAVVDWIRTQVQANPGRQTVGSTTVHHWRIDDAADQSEVVSDGDDEATRLSTIELVGVYQ